MARLPIPGDDNGSWGTILNDFLINEHNPDGSQKPLPQSKVTNLAADLAAKEDKSAKGIANGYAPLDSFNKVPVANLPASTAPDDASTSTKGLTKLSTAPISATDPIAIAVTDPKVTADQAVGVASIRTLGYGAGQAAQGSAVNTRLQTVESDAATGLPSKLSVASNLSDVANVATARTNLGVGLAAGLLQDDAKCALALRQARSAIAGGTANIVTLSDSILEGYNISSYTGRIPYLMMRRLRASFQPTGVSGGIGYLAPYMEQGQTADYPVTNTGGTHLATFGLGNRALFWSAAGQKSVLTLQSHTAVDLYYFRSGTGGAAGAITYKIDSGSTTTITLNSGTVNNFASTRVTLPDSGSHTITVEWLSGATIFCGFMLYNGDESSGIRIWEGGFGGGETNTFIGTANQITYLTAEMATIQPQLVVIELGLNDWSGPSPITAATFQTRINTLISTVRGAITNDPSIILVKAWELSAPSGPAEVGTWNSFTAMIDTIAASDPEICVFNAQARIRPILEDNTAKGLLGVDKAHPSDAGAKFLGKALADFVI